MTVLGRPYRAKGGTNDINLAIYPRMRKKVVFSPPHFFFHYKNVGLFVLRAVLPCLPACISHKHPVTLPLAEFFPHRDKRTWASASKSWHQVSSFNQKTMGSSPLLSQRSWVIKVPSEARLGLSSIWGVWFQHSVSLLLLVASAFIMCILFTKPN